MSREETPIVLKAGKVALDIPCLYDGVIVEGCVTENEPIDEGEGIACIEVA